MLNYSPTFIQKQIQDYDIITIPKEECSSDITLQKSENVKQDWMIEHFEEDLNKIYERTMLLYPQYKTSFDKVLKSPQMYRGSAFIMKAAIFEEYSKWLFNILDIDIFEFREKVRIKESLSKILFNVFIEYKSKDLKLKEIKYHEYQEDKYTFGEKLFSLKNKWYTNKKYKIITFLGIKLKIKYKNSQINCNSLQNGKMITANSIYTALNKSINNKEFFNLAHQYIAQSDSNRLSQDEQLIYMTALISSNKTDLANNVLKKYIEKYGADRLWAYYRVAEFAYKQGINNNLIDISANSCSKLKLKKQEEDFKKLINGKTVAIVGNGPSEINSGRGKEIDSHDIVIRMNNYRLKGFEKDYGTKIDIWARGTGASDVEDKTKKCNYKACFWGADVTKFRLNHQLLSIMDRDLKNPNLITQVLDEATAFEIKEKTGVFFPTTGFNTICYILLKCSPQKVDYYGFSFLQKKVDKYATHYFNDRSKKEAVDRSCVHNFDKEAEYLKELIYKKGGPIPQ